jgi:hypothetical protein
VVVEEVIYEENAAVGRQRDVARLVQLPLSGAASLAQRAQPPAVVGRKGGPRLSLIGPTRYSALIGQQFSFTSIYSGQKTGRRELEKKKKK